MYRLLIVEDELHAQEGLKLLCEAYFPGCFLIQTAANGARGLAACQSAVPDIIFADIRMPDMDGLTMIERLRQQGCSSEIVILSGYAEFSYAQKALSLLVFDYLLKPISPSAVQSIIQRVLEKIECKNQVQSLFHRKNSFLSSDPETPRRLYEFYQKQKIIQLTAFALYWGDQPLAQQAVETLLHQIPFITRLQLKNQHITVFFASALEPESFPLSENATFFTSYPRLCCVSTCLPASLYLSEKVDLLVQALPFSISLQKHSFAIEECTDKANPSTLENAPLKRQLKAFFQNGSPVACGQLLIDFLKTRKKNPLPPKAVKDFVISCFFKFESHQFVHLQRSPEEMHYVHCTSKVLDAVCFVELLDAIREYYAFRPVSVSDASYSKLVHSAITIIQQDYARQINLNGIAEVLGVTPQYLSRLFVKETKENFTDYLINYRMQMAKELIKNSNLKIYEISEKCGFPDSKYFATIFKKLVNCTPNEFRKKDRAEGV